MPFRGSVFVNIPIFSGFLFVNQERQAKEFVRAASANVRNTELLVTLDVLTSYYSFKAAVQSLRYTEDYLKYSAESYEAALATYQEGIATILDLLASQRALADAKARHIQARTNWAIALSNISFAVGTLGTEAEIKPWEQRASLKGTPREK
jgi:outer membrane protein